MIAERGLRRALAALQPPIAFLDFETVSPAVPLWPGCHPYDQVPVQFSCHVETAGGNHHEWIADGPADPREYFARALIAACAGAGTVLAYNAPFERGCIKGLIEALPHLKAELTALSDRIRDLLSILRDHVYHPDFLGSFSLKDVLPALVPGFGYDDLKIQGSSTASAAPRAAADRRRGAEYRRPAGAAARSASVLRARHPRDGAPIRTVGRTCSEMTVVPVRSRVARLLPSGDSSRCEPGPRDDGGLICLPW